MTKKVILHCKQSVLSHVLDNGHTYEVNGNQIDVIVDDVDISDDVEFCNYHNIDYNEVNSIDAFNYCAI